MHPRISIRSSVCLSVHLSVWKLCLRFYFTLFFTWTCCFQFILFHFNSFVLHSIWVETLMSIKFLKVLNHLLKGGCKNGKRINPVRSNSTIHSPNKATLWEDMSVRPSTRQSVCPSIRSSFHPFLCPYFLLSVLKYLWETFDKFCFMCIFRQSKKNDLYVNSERTIRA